MGTSQRGLSALGSDSIQRWCHTRFGKPIVEIKQSYVCLISTMGFSLLVKLLILNQDSAVHICSRTWPYLVLSRLLSQLPKSILVWGVWWILCHQNTGCMGRGENTLWWDLGMSLIQLFKCLSEENWNKRFNHKINFRGDICKVLAMWFRCNWINLMHLHGNLMYYLMLLHTYIFIFT